MRIILLPGLDGSTKLRREFINTLSRSFDVIAIDYPNSHFEDYSAIEKRVLSVIDRTTPYILFAESFSGPIALSIAANNPINLKGLIICASFASSPLRQASFLRHLTWVLPSKLLPRSSVRAFLLNKNSDIQHLAELDSILNKIPSSIIRRRLNQVLSDRNIERFSKINVPSLYIQATHDHLVFQPSVSELKNLIPAIQIQKVNGAHSLLQINAKECTELTEKFIQATIATSR